TDVEFGESDSDDELKVILAELKATLADYLATRPGDGPRTLADVVAFNRQHADVELAHFGQSLFETALAGPDVGSREYADARARPIALVNAEAHPGSCTGPAAVAGYPLLTVPSGLAAGLPVAVSFWGSAGSERTLLEVAAGYEAARDRDAGPLAPPGFAPFV